jgi:hypothetical protein
VAQVAKEQKVSKSTVKRAISSFCGRCNRVGIVKDCPQCAELRAANGTKKPKPRPKKQGAALIDWKEYERCLGVVVRLSDWMKDHYTDHLRAEDQAAYLAAVSEIVRLKDLWFQHATGKAA